MGFIGGAFLTFIFLAFKSERGDKIRKVAVGLAAALFLLVAVFLMIKDLPAVRQNSVLGRFSTLSVSEFRNQGRYYVWPMAWQGFLERPIFGWGQEGFNFVFNKYYDPEMYNQELWFDRTHNSVLDWLVASGLVGALSYLSIFGALLYYIFKPKQDFLSRGDQAVFLGLISAYFFHNLFVFDQIGSYILFFTVLAYVHSHAPEPELSWWDKLSARLKDFVEREKWRPVIEASILIVLLLALYTVNFLPWKYNKNIIAVLMVSAQGGNGNLETYQKPFSSYGMWFSESLEHVSQAAIGIASNPNTSSELKQNIFETVDKAFKRHIEKVPNDSPEERRAFSIEFAKKYAMRLLYIPKDNRQMEVLV